MCFSHYDLNAALQGACIETMARHLALPADGAIIVRLLRRSTNLNERKLTTPWRQDLKIGRCRFEAG